MLETATDEQSHRVGGPLDDVSELDPLCRAEAF